ncbi:MAG TPA: hypothetical protein VIF09_10035 [Polyangiaceae bacterium]|jgi:DNA-directed RNA polymerase specialized sigma24 family protein
MPPDAEKAPLPPELQGVTREELRDVYVAATRYAQSLLKSKARAEDVVQRAFEKLLTTRRWNPAGGVPLLHHMLGVVKSMVSDAFKSKAHERADRAHGEFQRDVGEKERSPEEATLDRAETEGRQSDAESELDRLEASVSGHDLAPRVLRCRRDGKVKASDIARELDVPVAQVYRANEMLKDHLRKIRAEGGEEESEES